MNCFYDGSWPILNPSACLSDRGSINDIQCDLAALMVRATQPLACIACVLRRGIRMADAHGGAVIIRHVVALVSNFCSGLLCDDRTRQLCEVLRLIAITEARGTSSNGYQQTHRSAKEIMGYNMPSIVLDQFELGRRVFTSAHFQGRAAVTGLLVYLGVLHQARKSIDNVLSVAVIRVLVSLGEYGELVQLFQYKVLPDSAQIAGAALCTESAALHQLACDMLSRLTEAKA